jgi:hypothetical protein
LQIILKFVGKYYISGTWKNGRKIRIDWGDSVAGNEKEISPNKPKALKASREPGVKDPPN